jgi:hypothetical protein
MLMLSGGTKIKARRARVAEFVGYVSTADSARLHSRGHKLRSGIICAGSRQVLPVAGGSSKPYLRHGSAFIARCQICSGNQHAVLMRITCATSEHRLRSCTATVFALVLAHAD